VEMVSDKKRRSSGEKTGAKKRTSAEAKLESLQSARKKHWKARKNVLSDSESEEEQVDPAESETQDEQGK